MTEKQLLNIVDQWVKRLGLSQWTIKTVIGLQQHEDEDSEDLDVFARIFPHQRYDDAVLEIADWVVGQSEPPDRIEAAMLDDALIERKVIHELLHCITRDVRSFFDDHLDGFLHRDAAEIVRTTFIQCDERAIDNLARALQASWPS